jgi:hypothetical protein
VHPLTPPLLLALQQLSDTRHLAHGSLNPTACRALFQLGMAVEDGGWWKISPRGQKALGGMADGDFDRGRTGQA